MEIRSFDPNALYPAHDGTILAHGIFSGAEIRAPFGCAFGVLKKGMAQKPERNASSKLYYVRRGEGVMNIEGEERVIREGDVAFIPANALHTVRNEQDGDFGTFAVWWTPVTEPE